MYVYKYIHTNVFLYSSLVKYAIHSLKIIFHGYFYHWLSVRREGAWYIA